MSSNGKTHEPSDFDKATEKLRGRALERKQAFLAEVNDLVKKWQQESLAIAVLGPSPEKQSPEARKREQVHDALVGEEHFVFFPEKLYDDSKHDVVQREFAMLEKADLIVLLPSSEGSFLEFGMLGREEHFARKMLVFIREGVGGFPRAFAKEFKRRGDGEVLEYSKEDLETCRLVEVSLECARKYQVAAYERKKRSEG